MPPTTRFTSTFVDRVSHVACAGLGSFPRAETKYIERGWTFSVDSSACPNAEIRTIRRSLNDSHVWKIPFQDADNFRHLSHYDFDPCTTTAWRLEPGLQYLAKRSSFTHFKAFDSLRYAYVVDTRVLWEMNRWLEEQRDNASDAHWAQVINAVEFLDQLFVDHCRSLTYKCSSMRVR